MTVARQIMWNRLISIVEEQAQALIRTAFSTSVREAGDLSAGVYDLRGRMLAQAVTGTPGHVNAMAEAVAHFMRLIGTETMRAGDVYITNDPWLGTGHLHDITVVSPAFHNGRHVGYFGCTAHIVDIGGRGFGAEAGSVYEEGLQIPHMRMIEGDGTGGGRVNETLVVFVKQNVREPEQVTGDIFALAACNNVGERRLSDMMAEYGLTDIEDLADFVIGSSEKATRERIAALPRARAAGEMMIDGYATPIRLCAAVETRDDHVLIDFAGTSGMDPKGINVPAVYTRAYAAYAVKVAVAPDIPNNTGSLAPFVVESPEGSIVNARRPAPVALRHVIGHMIPDTVFGALRQILPGIPAEGAGALCNFQVSLRETAGTGRSEVLCFNSGGSGARHGLDGMSSTAFPSGVMTMPVEATEHAGPVIIWRKELRPDSGGAGTHRGGLGQYMEVGARDGWQFEFSSMLDRTKYPARGIDGGEAGGATEVTLSDGTQMPGKGRFAVGPGLTVRLAFPGGGGIGDPRDRPRDKVQDDLRKGYISAGVARDTYGLKD